MMDELQRLKEVNDLLATAHLSLLNAKNFIDVDNYDHVEKLVAQVGKLSARAELEYLREFERTHRQEESA